MRVVDEKRRLEDVVADLADERTVATITTTDGYARQGAVTAIGVDVVTLDLPGQSSRVFIALEHIQEISIRHG
jgi:hypothetical protein